MTLAAATAQGQGPRTEGETPPRQHAIAPVVGSSGPRGPEGWGDPGPRPRAARQALAARAALRRRFWATVPARLRLLRAATVLPATALAVLLTVAGLAANCMWDGVAGRDAPRTISAADLALNDMDAQAANILLSNGDAGKGRLRTPYEKALGVYGGARREIGHDLRDLAVAAQGDRPDEKTVENLTDDFAEYQELIGRALENDGRPGGTPSALVDYRRATDLLRSRPRRDAFDSVVALSRARGRSSPSRSSCTA
ncbi:hypothetical protein ABZZ74_39725 [Streptomyces sp. NPDC006476]|uniref:hypothetical protein n=1 Tax=Streptomyces sp. NPDC006476 TaxID=3157175 RepID=UPI0033A20577